MKYSLSFIFSFFLLLSSTAQPFDGLVPIDRPIKFPLDMTTLDMDNDGDKDFVFCESKKLYWIENLGNNIMGECQGPIYEATSNIKHIFNNDLDQDGDDDLQLGIFGSSIVITMDNLDNGLLGAPQEFNTVINIGNLILSDPEADGTRDLISYNAATIYRAIGNTDGSYGPSEQLLGIGGTENGVALKDLNGDGINDLIVQEFSSGDDNVIVWYQGVSNGEFTDPIIVGASSSSDMVVFDIDQDGDNDIVRSGFDGVEWFVNSGNGYFINTVTHNIFSESVDYQAPMSIADMDQDGDIDICVQTYDHRILWLENDGSTENWNVIEVETPCVENLDLSDINGDGIEDIVTYKAFGQGVSRITYSINDGNGSFQEHWDAGFTALGGTTKTIDVNGDGLDDLVSSDLVAKGVYLYLNAGNGMFKTQKTLFIVPYYTEESYNHHLKNVADIDGDGDNDIVFTMNYSNLGWTENLGEDKFQYRGVMEMPDLSSVDKTYFGDFNGDGLPDVLITKQNEGLAELHLATEPGVYEFDSNIDSSDENFSNLHVADLDNDSDLDVVLFLTSSHETRLYFNDGFGNFTANSEPIAATDHWLYVLDMDGDGDLDAFNLKYWLENDSLHRFSKQHFLFNLGDNGEYYLGFNDIDGDQDLDCLLNGERIQLNMGCGVYTDPINIGDNVPANFQAITLLDFDTDGDMDIILKPENFVPDPGEHRLYVSVNSNLGSGGCMDVTACNYDPNADFDDGSCCYTNCGCSNPNAENTNVSATCNDGSCLYEVSGFVFRDIDDSGDLNSTDVGMAFERVLLMPDSVIFTTDEYGQFYASFQGDEPRVLSVMRRAARDYMTTDNGYDINVKDPNWNNPIYEFGFKEVEYNLVHSLKAAMESPGRNYSCNDEVIHEFYITNDGNSTLDAVINVAIGNEFVGYEEIDDLTSLSDTQFRFTANLLEPGERRVFKVRLLTPEENALIEELQVTAEVIGFYEGDQVVQKSISKSELLNCNPENNIISSEPKGYTVEHYIVGDELIRYNLEFQNNTSNNVVEVIMDNVISDDLEIKDLQIIDAPGLSYCTINIAEHTMVCRKQNADLAPSAQNYDNSYGHIIFDVQLKPGLTPGTVINISNSIVFDGDSESSGSYFHTIVDCNDFSLSIEPSSLDLCLGEEVFVEGNGTNLDNIDWSFGGESLGDDESIIFSSIVAGEDILFLTAENSVCTNSISIPVSVTQTLFAEVEGNFEFCEGDSTTISSTSSVNNEWMFNNDLIGTGSEVTLYQGGNLQLILNDGQCISTPLSVQIEAINPPATPLITNIDEILSTTQINGYSYQWYFEGEIISGATSNSFDPDLTGIYMVEISNAAGCSSISTEEVVVVGVNEIENDLFNLYPNPMSDHTVLEFGGLKNVSNIYISDSSGRIVRIDALSNNQNNHLIKKGNLIAGNYFISFVYNNQIYRKQLIIL